MIDNVYPFINFGGDCAAAIELYKSALGAEVVASSTFAEMPGDVPPELADKIMYAMVKVGGGTVEMSDVPPGVPLPPAGNTHVNVHWTDVDAMNAAFATMSQGGSVQMPLDDMFWGARFGKLVDRYGAVWTFHCQLTPPA